MNTEQQTVKEKLLTLAKTSGFYVPLVRLADSFGIEIFEQQDYQRNKDGHIEVCDETNRPIIIVNANKPATRQRFTIAHELGHYALHNEYLHTHGSIDRNGDTTDANYRLLEQQANAFAAELLMPENAFIQQWNDLDDLVEVADYFYVSPDAAKYRALNLGLYSPSNDVN